ncbi:MAG: hypothetical protein IKH30_01335 [Clostridia bacterium]|nr:hypothetical protein [Clostridia bacterium]
MKKLLAAVFCLVLALSCLSALAQEEKTNLGVINVNGAFNLKCALPEDYRLEVTDVDSTGLKANILPLDPAKPSMILIVEFDDMYAQVERLNDLSDEDLAFLESTYDEYKVEFTYSETSYGTKLLIAKEVGDDEDFVSIFSIYKGYQVEFIMLPGESSAALTDAQIQQCIAFLSELDFVPVE